MAGRMFRFMAVSVAVFGWAAVASAQEVPAADAYKVAFENDHVRIERAHYPANTKIASHAHPPSNTVYVYLNDSEGVIFRHTSGASHTVTRQPVKTGALRISGGGNEHHSVENTSKTATDFLRVVLKTQSNGRGGGRLAPTDMQYANSQIRINRLLVAPHQSTTVSGDMPSIVIEVPSGEPRWVEAGASQKIENHGARELMLVRIEFLTKPR
jgi:hypothetical protein